MKIKDLLDTVGAVIGCNVLINVLLLGEGAHDLLADGALVRFLWLWDVLEVIVHCESILQRSDSQVARVGEFGVVLVHVVNRAWHLIKAGQPKVALLKDIFVVKLWNGHHVGPLPSVVHDGREALRRLIITGG